MKKVNILRIVLIIAVSYFTGCVPAPKTPTIINTPYTFAEDEFSDGTAEITFSNKIIFVDVEWEKLPPPEEGTRWYPLRFPAGREFQLRVYILYHSNQPGYRRRGVFKCPPLEAEKKYKLWYEAAKSDYYSGAGRLILTYDDVKALNYFFGVPTYNQIHIQEIPPL